MGLSLSKEDILSSLPESLDIFSTVSLPESYAFCLGKEEPKLSDKYGSDLLTLFYNAVGKEEITLVSDLLKLNPSLINKPNPYKRTALHEAILLNNFD